MKKPPLPIIQYSGKLPLSWQIRIADLNIWLGNKLPVELTHRISMCKGLRRYYREQEEKAAALAAKENQNEHGKHRTARA